MSSSSSSSSSSGTTTRRPVTSSSSSSSSSSSPPESPRAGLSLSSPELLSELRASKSRPLRHVAAHNGLTTVFSGRGGQACGPAHSTQPANQRTSP